MVRLLIAEILVILLRIKEPYGCGDKHFDPKPSTKEVLDKYHITEKEYDTICNELEDKLWV